MNASDPMESFRAPYGETHRYGLKRWLLAFYCLLGLAFVAIASLPFYAKPSGVTAFSPGLIAFSLLFATLVIYFVFRATQRYVELSSSSITLGGMLGAKSMSFDTIQGRRIVRSRNGTYIVLNSTNPGVPRLSIPTYFAFDDYWRTWLQTIPDLDELDRRVILDAIASDASLGTTPEERLQKLATAKAAAIALSLPAVAIAGTLWLASHTISFNLFGILDLLLVIFPWIVLLLIALSPLLYTPISSKRDPRASLMFVLLASGLGLLASPFANLHAVAPQTLLAYASIPCLILAGVLYASVTKPKPQGLLIILLVAGGLYGYGLIQQINTQLDTSSIRQYSPSVLHKTTSSGRSTTYYLYLDPWDNPSNYQSGQQSVQPPSYRKVSVSSALYHSVKIGDSVCITAHDGTLHLGWYTVNSCNSPSGPR